MAENPIAFALLTTAVVVAAPAVAEAARPPPAVAQKIAVMDTACGVVGGRPGGGAYIFVYDFTGDGVNDYLLSEGNYNCVGAPNAFRANGKAAVEIYVAKGPDAPRAFHEVVRGYRIIDGRPRTVQVVREGPACRPTVQIACTVPLLWNRTSRRFVAASEAAAVAVPMPRSGTSAPAAGVLTAAEVRREIVGHRVAAEDGGMSWYYYANGKYDGDDGRNARGGTYVVRPDGRLCWNDNVGVSGCFQYYRKSGKLRVRRADPGHDFELGAVAVGPL
jgi:hypothetical protein